jgi:hypothetical protein
MGLFPHALAQRPNGINQTTFPSIHASGCACPSLDILLSQKPFKCRHFGQDSLAPVFRQFLLRTLTPQPASRHWQRVISPAVQSKQINVTRRRLQMETLKFDFGIGIVRFDLINNCP